MHLIRISILHTNARLGRIWKNLTQDGEAGGEGYLGANTHPTCVDVGFFNALVICSYIFAQSPLIGADFWLGSAVMRR